MPGQLTRIDYCCWLSFIRPGCIGGMKNRKPRRARLCTRVRSRYNEKGRRAVVDETIPPPNYCTRRAATGPAARCRGRFTTTLHISTPSCNDKCASAAFCIPVCARRVFFVSTLIWRRQSPSVPPASPVCTRHRSHRVSLQSMRTHPFRPVSCWCTHSPTLRHPWSRGC